MTRILAAVTAAVVGLSLGCGRDEQPAHPPSQAPTVTQTPEPAAETPKPTTVTIDDVKKEAGEALDKTAQLLAQEKDELVASLQQKLADMETQVSELRTKAATLSEAGKAKANAAIADVDEKMQTAKAELAQLKLASTEAFADVKARTSSAFDRLRQGIAEAIGALSGLASEPVKEPEPAGTTPPADTTEMFK